MTSNISSSDLNSDNNGKIVAPPDSKIDHDASIRYWNDVPATANGMLAMLGSYPSRIDLQGSKTFPAKARRLFTSCSSEGKLKLGVDCGAGVGQALEIETFVSSKLRTRSGTE